MKKFFRIPLYAMAAAAMLTGVISCDDNGGGGGGGDTNTGIDPAKTATLSNYVNGIVISTYSSLADEAAELYAACLTLKNAPTQTNLNAACEAWIDARVYWELSEAYLFGPADYEGVDPRIDSWPLDKTKLDNNLRNTILIANMEAHGCNFAAFESIEDTERGFHTVEYMLFRDGGPRNIDGGIDSDGNAYNALSAAELTYCVAVAEDMRNQTILLEASWAGVNNISAPKKAILTAAEIAPDEENRYGGNYGETMINAGSNNFFKTQIIAYNEILGGMIDIVDEVGNTKIADPISTSNVLDVESWYSWNSIADFADNIRGVRDVYLGKLKTTDTSAAAASSLSAYVKSLDAPLDAKIFAAMNVAEDEIENIPAPFRNHLTVEACGGAMDACNDLLDLLEEALSVIN